MTVLARSVFALAAVASCASLLSMRRLTAQTQQTGDYRISGPYAHENLSVFLIHGPNRSSKKLLTLEEALDEKRVVVYETRSANELAVENLSNEDVFIESGVIVKGGAQDRTLKDDL